MKYAITFRQDGLERPNFEFESQIECAKAWFRRHAGNVSCNYLGEIYNLIQTDRG